MARSVEQLIEDIKAYQPSGNENDDLDRLYAITESYESMGGLSRAVPVIIDAFERFPEAWWGNPGPLVHLVEHCGGHVDLLIDSIRRTPTPTTVWMVNRILNAAIHLDVRTKLLATLTFAANDTRTSEATRTAARSFLDHQSHRV
ncbi:MAG TPA: hypothetical protein VFV87_05230 [Pirellulaceae bacterium]|nr:hypothetical protein [Pirellulaceae bacterium]